MNPRPSVASALAGVPSATTALSLFSLSHRVALVTGGHGGIGLEMALALAEAGAVVYCLDLPSTPDADWVKVQGAAAPGRMEYLKGDVTDQKALWDAVEDIVKKEGRLDVCIANAGIYGGHGCLDYPGEDLRKVLDVNVAGVFFTAQAAGRQMQKLGTPGSIILIASVAGTVSPKGVVAYNVSKSSVLQMAHSLAIELAPLGIRVNSISPGFIDAGMLRVFLDEHPEQEQSFVAHTPMGRMAKADELRGAALWLASDTSSFCTGSDIKVDGGYHAC